MMKKWYLITMVLLFFGGIVSAVIIAEGGASDPLLYPPGPYEIAASANSRELYSTDKIIFSSDPANKTWRIIGPYNNPPNTDDGCMMLLFPLPDRGGQVIDVNMFVLFYKGKSSGTAIENIDLYAVDVIEGPITEPNAAILALEAYYYSTWAYDTNATPIYQGLVKSADLAQTGTWRATDPNANLRLSCFLNSLYDNGAEAGDYVVLRLNGSKRQNKYCRVDLYNTDDTFGGRYPKIYYTLAGSLPPCPDPILPPFSCPTPMAGDVYPNFNEGGTWVGGDCKIDSHDLDTVAEEWLQCDRVPTRLCDN